MARRVTGSRYIAIIFTDEEARTIAEGASVVAIAGALTLEPMVSKIISAASGLIALATQSAARRGMAVGLRLNMIGLLVGGAGGALVALNLPIFFLPQALAESWSDDELIKFVDRGPLSFARNYRLTLRAHKADRRAPGQ